MNEGPRLGIGITCYPSVGGSGILASELGDELARRGHEVHFISYEQPFRMPAGPRVFFHPVQVNSYNLFKYPDYTLPLSVKMAEVSRRHELDVLHVHYAVPHATAAFLACSMLPVGHRPKVITTLHGTDTTLLGQDPGYGPAIRHALEHSDGITTVSKFMRLETIRLLGVKRPIEVIPNFFEPHPPTRSRNSVRQELGVAENEALLLHVSNLRPLKRIDLLLKTVSHLPPSLRFKLVIIAGESFAPFVEEVGRLGLADRVVAREKVSDIDDYLQAADAGLFTSETESFCLSILELMSIGCPSAAFAVGGIPEVVHSGEHGQLVPFGDTVALARAVEAMIADPVRRQKLGQAARERARRVFSAAAIVPRYEAFYREVRLSGVMQSDGSAI